MTYLLSLTLVVALGVLLVPVLVLLVQVLLATLPPSPAPTLLGPRPRTAVLIPAHNEEAGLLATLSSVQCQLSLNDLILVVADNCSDNTAEIARRAGVDVVERKHAELRGKGYALDYGVEALAKETLINSAAPVPAGAAT